MEDYGAMIRNTFQFGSIRDAQQLFEACVRNAFPASDFRRLELIRFTRDSMYLEGRSWNHVFEISQTELKGSPVWDVRCHRVTMGRTPDKQAYLDYLTLDFIQYAE